MTTQILDFLSRNGISFTMVEHPPVMNCGEARQMVPHFDGMAAKNLFLRDKKGVRHILIVVDEAKDVDLTATGKLLDAGRLSFGSPERLEKHLGIKPGAVSLLALMNDTARSVELVVDKDVWEADAVGCHPLVNTATLCISHEGIEKFFDLTGHKPKILDIPVRS